MNSEQGLRPFQQGYDAFGSVPWGKSELDYCPYCQYSDEGKQWLEGYCEKACNWYDEMWAE